METRSTQGPHLLNPPEPEEAINPYHDEQKPYDDMQNIINCSPKKMLHGWKMQITRQRLVKIDQPESGIKETYQPLFPGPQNKQTDHPKEDMKDIVRPRSAGETLLGRYEKSCHAN